MSAMFDVRAVFALSAQLRETPKKLDKIRARASATLARRLPVVARRDMQQEYNLPATRINQGLSARRVGDVAELRASAKRIGLMAYGATWRGRRSEGATVRVLKSGGRKTIRSAFIARGQVYRRERKGAGRVARLPLERLTGPSIAQMLRKGDRKQRIADVGREVLQAERDRLSLVK